MLEADFYGKLLLTRLDIMAILLDIRAKYNIPEIRSEDNGFKILPEASEQK